MADKVLRGLALLCCLSAPLLAHGQLPRCDVGFADGHVRSLPLAATPEARSTGLSGRDEVGEGMLFAWAEEGERRLWMKDTRVPLSAAFIDGRGVVRRVVDMQPYSLDEHAAEPVRYIVEVAKGELEGLGVRVGSRVSIDCR